MDIGIIEKFLNRNGVSERPEIVYGVIRDLTLAHLKKLKKVDISSDDIRSMITSDIARKQEHLKALNMPSVPEAEKMWLLKKIADRVILRERIASRG